MWFVDHAQITVKAGDGGRGCSAFAQPPYTRFPYPDGGDGGDGGDVVVRADPNVASLLDFHFRHEFKARRGGHGGSNRKTGKRGEDLTIRVPVGTVIRDAETGQVLRDLTEAGEQVVIAAGGRGGLGNATRWTSLRAASGAASRGATAPEAMPGTRGEGRRVTLELKLIADVGITGFPNAGKSSLLARISSARPKVGAYPFTTRYPVLGVVEVPGRGTFVACDIPGLIEGAHAGKGLGIQFLRHIERTRLLVHLIDMAAVDGRDPVRAFHQLNRELTAYSPALRAKPHLVVANKMDLPQAAAHLALFQQASGELPGRIWPISCATGAGIPALLHAVWERLHGG
jgi:GTP-binding protein